MKMNDMNYYCPFLTFREYSEGSGDYFYCLRLKEFIFPAVEAKCKNCSMSKGLDENE